jgi:hypothetical protein
MKYSIKQIVSALTVLPKIAFTSMHAYRVFTNLSLEIELLSKEAA